MDQFVTSVEEASRLVVHGVPPKTVAEALLRRRIDLATQTPERKVVEGLRAMFEGHPALDDHRRLFGTI